MTIIGNGKFRLLAIAAVVGMAVSALAGGKFKIEWDDFSHGFSASSPSDKWFYFAAGPFVGSDGIESTSNKGLLVRSPGVNPITGKPAFTLTMPQEGSPGNPFSLPGGFDHVKWLAYANHFATTRFSGFYAEPHKKLTFETWIDGQSYGNEFNPFAGAVTNPNDDVRLATPAMNTIDLETYLVSDFFFTNERVYALYERLPFGRVEGHNYAAFTYAIPVARRHPGEWMHLSIAYDRSAGTMRWLIDDQEVFRVSHLGHRIDRRFMILDHGGDEETVVCNQRDVGMGTFTLLDGGLPTQNALVKLSNATDFYYSTLHGFPTAASFLDPLSADLSRLWGEGADLRVKKVVVGSK